MLFAYATMVAICRIRLNNRRINSIDKFTCHVRIHKITIYIDIKHETGYKVIVYK